MLLFAVFVVVAAGVDRRWGVLSGTVLFGGRWISSSGSAQAPQNKPCGPPFWDRSSTFPKMKKKRPPLPTDTDTDGTNSSSMLALKKKREAEAKAKAEAEAAAAAVSDGGAGGAVQSPGSAPTSATTSSSSASSNNWSLLGVAGKKTKGGGSAVNGQKKRTPGEIRIQKGECNCWASV